MSDFGSFHYKDGELFCEGVPVQRIAEEVGTPIFIYSHAYVCDAVREYKSAFRGMPLFLCYAVKANANIAILRLLGSVGCGAEVISGGELFRARQAGINRDRTIFDGPGKSQDELQYALREDVLMFNVESHQELEVINHLAGRRGVKARVALRVNPDVNPKTHPDISTGLKKNKFGIPIEEAYEHYTLAANMRHLEVVGVHQHIGSQIVSVTPYKDSVKKLVRLIEKLRSDGIKIKYLDIGGGPGIRYGKERALTAERLAGSLRDLLEKAACKVIIEPGRSIVGNAGALITRLIYTKNSPVKNFFIVDAAMNDLIRPSLYQAYHEILPVQLGQTKNGVVKVDVVGPVCESGDYLAREREMPRMERGSLLAVMSAGAYGFTMASNYNSRPRAAEVLVRGGEYHVIRRRENYRDLIRGEKIPAFLL